MQRSLLKLIDYLHKVVWDDELKKLTEKDVEEVVIYFQIRTFILETLSKITGSPLKTEASRCRDESWPTPSSGVKQCVQALLGRDHAT